MDPRLHRPPLEKGPGEQCFQRSTGKGLYIWDALYRSWCHMAGQDGEEETAASQWPLVRCIYNRAQCRGGADSRSLTARKHTAKGRKGAVTNLPSQAFLQLAPFSRSPPDRPPMSHLLIALHGARQGCCPQWMVHN